MGASVGDTYWKTDKPKAYWRTHTGPVKLAKNVGPYPGLSINHRKSPYLESSIESRTLRIITRVTLPWIIHRKSSFENHQPRIIYQPFESHLTQDHPSAGHPPRIIHRESSTKNHQSRVTLPRIIHRESSTKNHQSRVTLPRIIYRESSTKSHQSIAFLTNVSSFQPSSALIYKCFKPSDWRCRRFWLVRNADPSILLLTDMP